MAYLRHGDMTQCFGRHCRRLTVLYLVLGVVVAPSSCATDGEKRGWNSFSRQIVISLTRQSYAKLSQTSYEIFCCDITLGMETLRLIGAYRAPSRPSNMNSQPIDISDLAAQCESCVLTGDFDYPNIQWERNKGGSKSCEDFLEMCSPLNFSQLVTSSAKGRCLQLFNDWTNFAESGMSADVIYCDFEKAFEKVPHYGLFKKLSTVRLHPKIVRWISIFIHNLVFRVLYNGRLSTTEVICSGVPYGSLSNPFQHLLRGIPSLVISLGVTCRTFANDLKLYSVIPNSQHTERNQAAIMQVVKWSQSHPLSLTKEKSKVPYLGKNYYESLILSKVIKSDRYRN